MQLLLLESATLAIFCSWKDLSSGCPSKDTSSQRRAEQHCLGVRLFGSPAPHKPLHNTNPHAKSGKNVTFNFSKHQLQICTIVCQLQVGQYHSQKDLSYSSVRFF